MAGDVQDGLVHRSVECEEPVLVAGPDPLALCGDLPAQRCDLLAGGGLRGAANGKAFQRFADELAVGDSGEIDWRNVSTDLWDHAQQTVLNQALKDLSDGRAADSVLCCDDVSDRAVPGRIWPVRIASCSRA
jgi:hypothetical protein